MSVRFACAMEKPTSSPLDLAGEPFVCSWSGGKDSCIALYRAVRAGGRPVALLNMLTETGRRSRSHGLRLSVLQAQAAALGIPLVTRSASWDRYEDEFLDALRNLAAQGIRAAVFGDIAGAPNRRWVESVCARCGMRPVLPLWGSPRTALLEEFVALGFRAMVVVVRKEALDSTVLGRTLERDLLAELIAAGIDPSGEGGEYHTVVWGGPGFARHLTLHPGERVLRDGCWFLDVSVLPQRETAEEPGP
jgi:diphthine-ammonia ligase